MKQKTFSELFAKLILHAISLGYEVTLGETWRAPETVAAYAADGRGISHSLHPLKLAGDMNLFRNGIYLDKTSDHEELGTWWEGLSCDDFICAWGGRFNDGNHYSIMHQGVR